MWWKTSDEIGWKGNQPTPSGNGIDKTSQEHQRTDDEIRQQFFHAAKISTPAGIAQ
jgi:hypothetical protein